MVARTPIHRPLFGVLAGVPAGDYQTAHNPPQRPAERGKGISGRDIYRPLPLHPGFGTPAGALAGTIDREGSPRRASPVRSRHNDSR
jgi:hypothetical protein